MKNIHSWSRKTTILLTFILICNTGFANAELLMQARTLQHGGKYEEAIDSYKSYLLRPVDENGLDKQQLITYTEALMQLMNTFQSKGEPEACVSALQELFDASPILQKQCLRDYYSVLGYALSRTEKMNEAEETMLKVFTIPLNYATPERYFRDYAYAAAVFYSNPDYREEVISWCQEALQQARLCKNTSGAQWVSAMLGSLYKRNGQLNKALEMFKQSKEEAQSRNDDLGMLNSLHVIIDIFLYWDIPEYANSYASEAIRIEKEMTVKNPMVSAQTYVNKGRALLHFGETDSVAFYIRKARELCKSLPYNSGMADVDLLHGMYLTGKGADSTHIGIQELQKVARQGTATNRARAYHQLAQTYLKNEQNDLAEVMLDSMYSLLNKDDAHIYIKLDYKPILNHYQQNNDHQKVELYTRMMLREHEALKENKLNFNIVEVAADLQTEQERPKMEIIRHEQTNRHHWLLICAIFSLVTISVIVAVLLRQRRRHRIEIKHADEELALLVKELNRTSAEKDMISQEFEEMMNDKDNRQEIETLTPSVLQKNGESKFRQRFELLYPLFLPRLRERVPSITRREELLSMLIVLKQGNKEIAELLAIAPRSVLMLRHRFRQKVGLTTDGSLEKFIEETLGFQSDSTETAEPRSNS